MTLFISLSLSFSLCPFSSKGRGGDGGDTGDTTYGDVASTDAKSAKERIIVPSHHHKAPDMGNPQECKVA